MTAEILVQSALPWRIASLDTKRKNKKNKTLSRANNSELFCGGLVEHEADTSSLGLIYSSIREFSRRRKMPFHVRGVVTKTPERLPEFVAHTPVSKSACRVLRPWTGAPQERLFCTPAPGRERDIAPEWAQF